MAENGESDLVVKIKDDYDYRFKCNKRQDLIKAIQIPYYKDLQTNLPIYGVHDPLEKYMSAKEKVWINWSAGKGKTPAQETRMSGEDLYPEQIDFKQHLAPLQN